MVRSPNSPRATTSHSRPSRKQNALADADLAARTHQGGPFARIRGGAQQKDLGLATEMFVALGVVAAHRQRMNAGAPS